MQTKIDQTLYTIGTASKLTNIPVNTIRTWERRYFKDLSIRSETGRRHFNEQSIQRLRHIKTLSDGGMSVRDLSSLPIEKLEDLIQIQPSRIQENNYKSFHTKVAVTITGKYFLDKLTHFQNNYSVIKAFDSIEDLVIEVANSEKIKDTVTHFIDYKQLRRCDDLNHKLHEISSALNHARIIIFYDYAPRKEIQTIIDHNIEVIRTNVPHLLMDRYISEAIENQNTEVITDESNNHFPDRIFNDQQLYYLQEIDNKIECECPNHLGYIALALSSYVDYSKDCLNKDEKDRIMHEKLATSTSQALEIIEHSLLDLIKHENIQMPDHLYKK